MGDALHRATLVDHGDVVSDLLENGAPLNAKDEDGRTPLHIAANYGRMRILPLLLRKGADKDVLDNKGDSPVTLAIACGHVPAALALLAAGADVGVRYGCYKRSVVHVAAERGRGDIVRAAIERGADVDAVDRDQHTPLHVAAISYEVEAVDVLLEAGANVEPRGQEGCTPLHYVADGRCPEAMRAILKHGANVNAQDKDQRTPLHWAVIEAGKEEAAELVDLLLRYGADETIRNDEGRTAAGELEDDVEKYLIRAEDVEHVHELLTNAPAGRAWRRRGYLVLCRAHPDRVQQTQQSISAGADVARRTRSSAKMARTETGSCTGTPAGCSTVDGQAGSNWAVVVARVVVLQEEGIFRTIVGYL